MSCGPISINHKIICAAYDDKNNPIPYYLYPRSSISKTDLRLANSVGIIDSGYRGNIIGIFDYIGNTKMTINKGTRLVQLCSHNLLPFKSITIVDKLDDTERGDGGIGSTGK